MTVAIARASANALGSGVLVLLKASIAVSCSLRALIALGFGSVSGLAFDRNTNTLYGIDRDINRNINLLLTIDPATGAATAVGPTGAAMVGLTEH